MDSVQLVDGTSLFFWFDTVCENILLERAEYIPHIVTTENQNTHIIVCKRFTFRHICLRSVISKSHLRMCPGVAVHLYADVMRIFESQHHPK